MLALAYCKHIHAPTTQSHEDFEGRSTCTFRFWTDERRFKGPGGKCVVQEALFQAGALQNMHMFTCDWVIHDPVLVYPSIKAILTVCFNSMYTNQWHSHLPQGAHEREAIPNLPRYQVGFSLVSRYSS